MVFYKFPSFERTDLGVGIGSLSISAERRIKTIDSLASFDKVGWRIDGIKKQKHGFLERKGRGMEVKAFIYTLIIVCD